MCDSEDNEEEVYDLLETINQTWPFKGLPFNEEYILSYLHQENYNKETVLRQFQEFKDKFKDYSFDYTIPIDNPVRELEIHQNKLFLYIKGIYSL